MSSRRRARAAIAWVAMLIVAGAHAAQRDVTSAAVAAFEEWLGPLPDPPGVVSMPETAWPLLRGDRTRERAHIAELTRRYWFEAMPFPAGEEWAAAALVRFTAVRVISDLLESDHFATPGFFRGAVRFPVRYAPLSPDPWEGQPPLPTFDEIEIALRDLPGAGDPRGHRAARALQTLERYFGRPMFESAIGEFASRIRRGDSRATVTDLIATIEAVTGRELSWFFDTALRVDRRYDYAVASIDTSPGQDERYTSRVVVQRIGDAMFTGTSQQPVAGFSAGRGIEILVEFADGTRVQEHWDGRDESRTLEFTTRAPLVSAFVDPSLVLLLDENWENNGKSFAAPSRQVTLQWSLLWMAWLQQFMLSVTAPV